MTLGLPSFAYAARDSEQRFIRYQESRNHGLPRLIQNHTRPALNFHNGEKTFLQSVSNLLTRLPANTTIRQSTRQISRVPGRHIVP